MERINPVINGKMPSRNNPGLDDKQHAFILFGDDDRLCTSHVQSSRAHCFNNSYKLALFVKNPAADAKAVATDLKVFSPFSGLKPCRNPNNARLQHS